MQEASSTTLSKCGEATCFTTLGFGFFLAKRNWTKLRMTRLKPHEVIWTNAHKQRSTERQVASYQDTVTRKFNLSGSKIDEIAVNSSSPFQLTCSAALAGICWSQMIHPSKYWVSFFFFLCLPFSKQLLQRASQAVLCNKPSGVSGYWVILTELSTGCQLSSLTPSPGCSHVRRHVSHRKNIKCLSCCSGL